MPQWKKVIMSGSNISALNNDANYVPTTQTSSFVTSTDSDPITGSLVSKGFQAIGQEHTIGGTDIQEDTTSINVSSSAIVTPSRASTNPYNNYFGNNGDPLGVQGFKFLPQSTPQRLQSYRFNSSENVTNILLNAGFAGDATSTFHQLKTGSAFEVFGLNTGTKADGFNPSGGGFNELYANETIAPYNNLTTPDKLPPYASDNTPGVGMTIGGINHDQTNSQTTSSFYQAELLCYPGKNYKNNTSPGWSSYQSGLSINLLSSKGGTATSIRMREALRITDKYVYVPGDISASGDFFVDTLTTAGTVTFKGEETKFETTIIGASPIGVNDTFIITGSRENRTGSFTNPAIIASGSTALNTIGSLKFESLSSTSETTGLVINSSDVVSKRAFGTNAFTSTSIPTAVTDLSDVSSAGSGQIITTSERNAISSNTSNISTNTSNISTNTSNISAKPSLGTSATTALRGDTTASIAANASNISTNTSNISTNTSNISTNTSNISGKAASGANSDITSITGLTTPLAVGQGGTGVSSLDGIGLSEFDNDENFYKAGESIKIANGLLATPSLAFNNDQNTGIYSVAADALGIAAGASLIATFSGTGLQITAPLLSSNGTNSAPGISFSGDTNTGFYASNPDEISVTRGGTQSFKFDSNGFQQLVAGGTSQFAGHLQAHCLGIGGTPSTTSGEIWAYGDVVANKSSDKRLKKKIKNIPNALEKVSKINGVSFEWKKTDDKMKREVHSHEGHDIGVIAQEVEEVLPEIVATRDNGYKAVYYEKLVPLLIEAVKELKAEVDELKKSK